MEFRLCIKENIKSKDLPLLSFNPRIERTFLKLFTKKRKRVNIAKIIENTNEERVLRDHIIPTVTGFNSSIHQLCLTTSKSSPQ